MQAMKACYQEAYEQHMRRVSRLYGFGTHNMSGTTLPQGDPFYQQRAMEAPKIKSDHEKGRGYDALVGIVPFKRVAKPIPSVKETPKNILSLAPLWRGY
jgi:hypothetical protein